MAGELFDLCRWHIIFAEGLNHSLSGAVIAEFIVLKTRFSWYSFHKAPEFVAANGIALESAFVSRFGFYFSEVKRGVGIVDFF